MWLRILAVSVLLSVQLLSRSSGWAQDSQVCSDPQFPLSSSQIEACQGSIPSLPAVTAPSVLCPHVCEFSGAPGWGNIIRPGGGGAFAGALSPQECCKACAADPSCAQWAFLGNQCQFNVGTTCVGPLTAFANSGIIRCPNEMVPTDCVSAAAPTMSVQVIVALAAVLAVAGLLTVRRRWSA